MDAIKPTKPSIYYVVQGRRTENDSDYIEHVFMNLNPLEARERAFSYLEYYIQLLQQGKKIFFKLKDKLFEEEIKLERLNNYTVLFSENNFGIDGIAIYMVVNEPIEYMGKLDTVEDRYLIYAVQNLTEDKINNIKHSLIREYSYYRHAKIETSINEDEVNFTSNKKLKLCFQSNIVYTILKTPFDFYFAKIKTDDDNLFYKNVAYDFKVINLKKTTFISKLDWHIIRVHVASLINTKGGNVYLGKYVDGKIINCIQGKKISETTNLLKKNILPYFKNQKYYISFRFVTINKVIIPIIIVNHPYKKFSFYDNITSNNFYYRTKKGLKIISETSKIAEYVIKNGEYKLSDLADILDKL